MNCYEAIDLMGNALEGVLAGGTRAGFDDHLQECGACRTYFDQLQVTLEALARLPRDSQTSRRRSELIAAFRREFRKEP